MPRRPTHLVVRPGLFFLFYVRRFAPPDLLCRRRQTHLLCPGDQHMVVLCPTHPRVATRKSARWANIRVFNTNMCPIRACSAQMCHILECVFPNMSHIRACSAQMCSILVSNTLHSASGGEYSCSCHEYPSRFALETARIFGRSPSFFALFSPCFTRKYSRFALVLSV